MMQMPGYCFGVTGWPLAQTLSPLLHNTGFQALDFPGVMFAWPVKLADLELFVNSVRLLNIRGCCITIPHKIAIMPLLDEICEDARNVGAVNTLFWRDGKLCGDNTDVMGFLAPLEAKSSFNGQVLLLGAGGAARAVCAGLKSLGLKDVFITSKSNKRQAQLAEKYAFTSVEWEKRYSLEAGLIINATPLGMLGENIGVSPYDFSHYPGKTPGIAYDLVYNPLETLFLANAAGHGWECISGLEMFYWQANAQFMRWTGDALPVASRLALEDALGLDI